MAPEFSSSALKYIYTWGDIMAVLGPRLDRLARFELLKLPQSQRPPALMSDERFQHNAFWTTQDVSEEFLRDEVEPLLPDENITLPPQWKYHDDQLIKWYDLVENELHKGRKLGDIVIL